jgi:GNAT superfamily N-acetyltransferase
MTEDAADFEVVRTALEMHARPARPHARPPSLRQPVMLLRAERPTLSFYRYLYNTIGRQWFWYERRVMDDATLAACVQDDAVAVYVLYVGGVPAGLAEIDAREARDIELAYIGLMPEFIGCGLGRYLIDWAIDAAWDHEPNRIWIHTCTLDHPAALPLYQKAGFTPFGQNKFKIPDPRKMACFAD